MERPWLRQTANRNVQSPPTAMRLSPRVLLNSSLSLFITMKLPVFTVDSFTNVPLKGNPAAVCPLQHVSNRLMQFHMYSFYRKSWLDYCRDSIHVLPKLCFEFRSWTMICIRGSQQRWTCPKQLSSPKSTPLIISTQVGHGYVPTILIIASIYCYLSDSCDGEKATEGKSIFTPARIWRIYLFVEFIWSILACFLIIS